MSRFGLCRFRPGRKWPAVVTAAVLGAGLAAGAAMRAPAARPAPCWPARAGRHLGEALTVPGGSTTQGTDLARELLVSGSTSQERRLDSLGCGRYGITSAATGQPIDISGQSATAGAAVDQYDYRGGGSQRFVIADDGNGSSVSTSSINSMDPVEVPGFSTTSGANLDKWPSNGGTSQEWSLVPARPRGHSKPYQPLLIVWF